MVIDVPSFPPQNTCWVYSEVRSVVELSVTVRSPTSKRNRRMRLVDFHPHSCWRRCRPALDRILDDRFATTAGLPIRRVRFDVDEPNCVSSFPSKTAHRLAAIGIAVECKLPVRCEVAKRSNNAVVFCETDCTVGFLSCGSEAESKPSGVLRYRPVMGVLKKKPARCRVRVRDMEEAAGGSAAPTQWVIRRDGVCRLVLAGPSSALVAGQELRRI